MCVFFPPMQMWAVNMGQINITPSAVSVGFWAVVSHTQQSCPSTSLNAAYRCLFYFSNVTLKLYKKLPTCFDWVCSQTLGNALFLFSTRWTRLSTSPSSMASQWPWERMALGVWAKGGLQHSLVTPCKAFASSVSMKSLKPCTMICLERWVSTFGRQRRSAKTVPEHVFWHICLWSLLLFVLVWWAGECLFVEDISVSGRICQCWIFRRYCTGSYGSVQSAHPDAARLC